jgi:hypothetical protein
MDPIYDEQYLASVRDMKARGMDVFLLSAGEFRSRQQVKQANSLSMNQALRDRLRAECCGDLSVTSCSVDRLIERDKLDSSVQAISSRRKAGHSVD